MPLELEILAVKTGLRSKQGLVLIEVAPTVPTHTNNVAASNGAVFDIILPEVFIDRV